MRQYYPIIPAVDNTRSAKLVGKLLAHPVTRRHTKQCCNAIGLLLARRDMPTGAENVRSWRQTGSDRQTLKTALMTQMYGPAVRCKWILPSWR